jgi:uncharacterized protein involved in exopolysaccharide biosynthesis/Mrp family chromosome partitioning ATPase
MRRTETEVGQGSEDFDLQNFISALTRRWRLIAGVTAFCTLLAVQSVLFSSPRFAATGTVYLGVGDNTTSNDQTNFLSDYQVVSSVNAQVQLLQSETLMEQAILETGLNARIVPANAPEMPYWRWRLHYQKSVEIFAPGPDTLIAPFAIFSDPGATGVGFRLIFGKDGHFTLIEPGGLFSKPQEIGEGTWGKPVIVGGAAVLISSAAGSKAPVQGSQYDVTIIPAKVMAQDLAGSLSVLTTGPAVAPTNVATIQFVWDNPYQATNFVQHLMQDFIQSQMNWATESASNTETYISQQLDKINAALENANKNQAYYQSQTGIVDVNSNSQAVIAQLSAYQGQRSTILLQQEALQQLVKTLSDPHSSINPYLVTQSSDPVLSSLATTLANAEVKLETDETKFGRQSPEIRQQNATIWQIKGAIGQLLSNDEIVAAKNLANIDSLIANYQNQLKSVPAESLKVGQLSRSVDVLGTLYELLMQKEEEAEVSKAATTADTRIVNPAELPLFAVSPRPTITVATGVLFGLLIGFGIVLMQRAFSSKFRTEAEIRDLLPSSIYGVVPRRIKADAQSGILASALRTPFSESFRLLESKLTGLQSLDKASVILVTSAVEFDGKSTVAANIAKALAEGERRVLLVDADLECGNLHGSLGMPGGSGLAEVLQDAAEPQIVAVAEFRFHLLRAGQSHKSSVQLLNPERLRPLLAALREQFDFIILDAPPLPLVSDALTLAAFADMILSVVRVEHTPRRDFTAHCELLNGTKCLYGVVINGADAGKGAHYAVSQRARLKRQGWLRRLAYAAAGGFGRTKLRSRHGR